MKPGKIYSSIKLFICLLCSLLLSDQLKAQIPTHQDCLGAIPVCLHQYEQLNSFSGEGQYPNEIQADQKCPYSCMDGEKNSVWYVISVKTGGLLRFSLTPKSSSDDYDWAVYCLNNLECSDIYNGAVFMQSSCNACGNFGATGISSPNQGTKNCNDGGNTFKWNSDLPVQAGDTYVLCVSNWEAKSGSPQSGYMLDFSASTADIFDDVPALITAIDTVKGCAGSATVNIDFSENILCSSVNVSDFTITGPDGETYLIGSVSGAGCIAGGEQEKFFTLQNFYPTLTKNGTYTLTLSGSVEDLCTNLSSVHSVEFIVDMDPLPTLITEPADAMAPVGGIAKFIVETIGANTFKWQTRIADDIFFTDLTDESPYSGTTNDTLVINPATIDLGERQYRCIISGVCTPSVQSSVATLYVGDALAASASASPDVICVGESTQLNVSYSGGNTSQYCTFLWSSPDGYSSTLQNPIVEPVQTTVYSVLVNDGYDPITKVVTVTVNPLPIANAGVDQEINHGTITDLQGSVPTGTPPYSYVWQPSDSLFINTLQKPRTHKLRGSTLFSLIVTDGNGCVSEPDEMVVTIVGGPLNASPSAESGVICFGDTTRLHALPSGGDVGNYTCHWLVNDIEFSTSSDPEIIPLQNTTYTLVLDDGSNTVTKTVSVIVNPLPVINLTKPEYNIVDGEIQLCVFDSLALNSGYEGGEYLWDNGASTFENVISTSGISFDKQKHYVRVTEPITGCFSSDTVTVNFTFAECSYGFLEIPFHDLVKLFPNPAMNTVTLSIDGPSDDFVVDVTDLCGRLILKEEVHKTNTGILNHQISLQSISNTTCLVRIYSKQGSVVKKLVVTQ